MGDGVAVRRDRFSSLHNHSESESQSLSLSPSQCVFFFFSERKIEREEKVTSIA